MLTQRHFAIAVIALLAVNAIAFLALVLTPGGRDGLRTAYVFAEVLPGIPSSPVAWVVGNYVEERSEVSVDGVPLPLRIFRPADDEKHPALIMALGVTADYSDATLYKLSAALASTGVIVLTPESERLADGYLPVEEIDSLVQAFQYLQAQPYTDSQRVGFAGFSVGASLSVLAAADARIKDDVALVNFFGGYVELSDYAAAILGKQFYDGGDLMTWDSKPTPGRVLRANMVSLLQNPQERQILSNALNGGQFSSSDPETLATYRYLLSGTYDEAKLNEQALSDNHKRFLNELSTKQALQSLSTKVFVLVDKRDAMVPYVESEKAARFAERSLVKFTQVNGFEHVRPKNFISLFRFPVDFMRLARHIHIMLDSL